MSKELDSAGRPVAPGAREHGYRGGELYYAVSEAGHPGMSYYRITGTLGESTYGFVRAASPRAARRAHETHWPGLILRAQPLAPGYMPPADNLVPGDWEDKETW